MPLQKILVLHTAFIGDIVLTLPLLQRLHASYPEARMTFVTIPSAAPVVANHPAIHQIIVYDKRDRDAGVLGITRLARTLRGERFDVAIIPHRSFRSAVVGWLSRIPQRVGFSTGPAPWLFTDSVAYNANLHEIERNLSLLHPLGLTNVGFELPSLYPNKDDIDVVERFLVQQPGNPLTSKGLVVGFAPGSVWNTKRWLKEHFVTLGKMLTRYRAWIIVLGGQEDVLLCDEITREIGSCSVINAAGKLSLLQSAELIRRCDVLVSNDSAPMHLAVGVRTPVVAIFGPTVPSFGFAPRGERDVVMGMDGLACRPCSIHGGNKCPIETFVCMKSLQPDHVFAKVMEVIHLSKPEAQ